MRINISTPEQRPERLLPPSPADFGLERPKLVPYTPSLAFQGLYIRVLAPCGCRIYFDVTMQPHKTLRDHCSDADACDFDDKLALAAARDFVSELPENQSEPASVESEPELYCEFGGES